MRRKTFFTKTDKCVIVINPYGIGRSRPGIPTTASGVAQQGRKCKNSKARNIGCGCKIFYNGADGRKNGIGIVLREELAESVLEVKRVSDRLMAMKLEVKGTILNIVSAYALQVNNSMEEKNDFWEDLDGLIESILKERIVLGADLNGHVGKENLGNEEIMRGTVLEQEIRKNQWLWILGKESI